MSFELGALAWLGAAALVLTLAVVVGVCWPVRFEVSGRARGEPNGAWVVAGGMSLSFVSVAFVFARGAPLTFSLMLFGRRVSSKSLPTLVGRVFRPVPERVKSVSWSVWARIEPIGLGLKLLEERRHLRLRYLVIDVDYGFRDPLLTGRLVGALAALSGVLPAVIELRQRPRWDLEDSWTVSVDGRAVVKPWLVLLHVGAYVVRQLSSRRPAPRKPDSITERPSEVR